MTNDGLVRAIREPAKRFGVEFEANLAEKILSQVLGEPGNLPLMQFALSTLWDQQVKRRLTIAAYERFGGVHGALVNHAEQVYAQLSQNRRDALRQVMLRMVDTSQPGSDGSYTSVAVSRVELEEGHWSLIRRLADERLVVTAYDEEAEIETAEMIHEALIWKWSRLSTWLDESKEFLLWLRRFRIYLKDWDERRILLTGLLLDEALRWSKSYRTNLRPREIAFIEQSQNAKRKTQTLTVAALTIVFLVVGGLLFNWHAVRQDNRHRSTGFELANQARDLLNDRNAVTAGLLALESWRRSPTTDAFAIMTQAFAQFPGVERHPSYVPGALFSISHQDDVEQLAVNYTGTRLVSTGRKGVAFFTDTEKLTSLTNHFEGRILDVSFAGDAIVAIADDHGNAHIVNALTGRVTLTVDHPNSVRAIAFGDGPDALLSLIESGSLCTTDMDADSPTPICKALLPENGAISHAAFSNDGRMVAIAGRRPFTIPGSDTNTIRSFVRVARIADHEHADELFTLAEVVDVQFSPNGRFLAVAAGNSARLLEISVSGGTLSLTPYEVSHGGIVNDVSFQPGTNALATSSDDGTVRLTRPTRRTPTVLYSVPLGIRHIAFDFSGKLLAAAGSAFVEIVSIANQSQPIKYEFGSDEVVSNIAFALSGMLIISRGNAVHFLPSDPNLIVEGLCKELGNYNLDDADWERFVEGPPFPDPCDG